MITANLTPEQEAALIEKLADLEHKQWGHWARHFLEFYNRSNRRRWERQSHTAYKNLSETEKESDRMWARKVLKLLTEFNIPSSITEQQTMGINGKEAVVILSALGDEDGEITEAEQNLEKRIRKEFPVIGEALKKREYKNHLWEHEVEDDKRVREAREKLEKPISDVLVGEFMALKRKVLHELMEKGVAK